MLATASQQLVIDNLNDEDVTTSHQEEELKDSTTHARREKWGSHTEFLLASVGFAIGIGNVWRFGVLAYRYGGGSFLVPYITALVFLALPLFVLEMLLGQTLQLGTYHALKFIHPRLRGVGIAACMVVGFRDPMPWASAPQLFVENFTEAELISNLSKALPAEDFWTNSVLERSQVEFEFGHIVWPILAVLFLAWLIVFVSLRAGIATSGKLLYVTAILPLIILLCLAFVTITLNGAINGIWYYIQPDWNHLSDVNVWHVAAQQVFYSLGPGFGTVISLASYNEQRYNAVRDSIIVGVVNSATSVVAGFVVFGFLGHLAHLRDVEVSEVVQAGQGLVFIAIPQALSGLAGASEAIRHLLTALFFVMLFFLGVDTQFANVEAIITLVKDLGCSWSQTTIVATISILGFTFGAPLATQGGIDWFDLMDTHAALFALFVIVLIEILGVRFCFGFERLADMYYAQSGFRISGYWMFLWKWVCPIYAAFLLVLTIIAQLPGKEAIQTPTFAVLAGWFFAMSPMVPIILCACTDDLTFKEKGSEAVHEIEHIGKEAKGTLAGLWKSMFGKHHVGNEDTRPSAAHKKTNLEGDQVDQQQISKVVPQTRL